MALGLTANAQTLDLTNSSNVYTVDSEKRGYLYYDEAKSTTYILSTWLECGGTESTSHPKADGSVTNNQFAFIKSTTSGKIYMYSVAAKKFLKQSETNIVLTEEPEASVTLTANGTFYLIAFESGDEINLTNWDGNQQGIRVAGADPDGGNKMTIALVSTSVDLSAAIEKVNPAVTPEPEPGISTSKEYRIKDVASGKYMNASNYDAHATGPVGGVNFVDKAESDDQIFTFEEDGTNYKLKTKSGKYIYCQSWNVDALAEGTSLKFVDNGDGTYYIMNGIEYFKVEYVSGAYYPYCNAEVGDAAKFIVEDITVAPDPEPEPSYVYKQVSRSNWTVTAFNETPIQGNGVEGGVSFIEDQDTKTFYHSAWGGTNVSWGDDGIQGFLIELPEATNIDRLTYLGRPDNNSGWATKVRIYVYNSLPAGFPVLKDLTTDEKNSQFARGQAWLGTPAFDNYDNAWAKDRNLKTADFASTQTGKYVFFVMDGGYDAWLTCSDIQLYKKVEAPTYSAIKASDFTAEKKYIIKNVSSSRGGFLYVGGDNALCIGELDDMNNAPNNYLFKSMPTNSGLVLKAVEGGYVPTGDGSGANLSATTVSKAAIVTVAAKGGTYPETTLNMLVNGNYCNANPGALCTWNDINDPNGVWEIYAIEDIANVEAAQMTTVTTLAEQALALDGVGYPVASERENLNNTVTAAKAFNTSGAWYEEMVNTLTAYASTTNINLPEEGKAYIFKNVMHTGDVSYFNCTIANGITIVANEASATPFICKNVGDNKFVFVTNDGKYMTWKGGKEGYNNNLGYTDSYDTSAEEWSHLTIEKLVSGGYTGSATAQDMFGLVAIKGRRNNANKDMNYFVIKNASSFDHAASMFFMKSNGNNFSSGFQMIEVEYPNKPVVNGTDDVEGVAAISTFCAPFATVAPSNVDVYIAASDESHYIKLQKVEGAVPANTGVVLVSEDNALAGQAITMVPATTETLADVTGNLLRGDAAKADYTVDAAVNAYVLGAVDGVAGFYPLSATDRTIKQGKAYLELDASLSAVKLYFGGDEATGIETVVKENANAPIFDLSGRRVVNVAKGGIYIQNGKKFIVK